MVADIFQKEASLRCSIAIRGEIMIKRWGFRLLWNPRTSPCQERLPSLKITARPWKSMVGRWNVLCDGLFSMAMLMCRGVWLGNIPRSTIKWQVALGSQTCYVYVHRVYQLWRHPKCIVCITYGFVCWMQQPIQQTIWDQLAAFQGPSPSWAPICSCWATQR